MRAAINPRIAVPAAITSGLLISGALVWHTSYAAFTATSSNPSNAFAAGNVTISDSANGTALFSATGLKPGSTDAKCITVTYNGSLSANVKLHAAYTSGDSTTNALAQYLTFKIEEIAAGAACNTATATEIDSADTTLAAKVTTLSPAAGVDINWNSATTGAQKQYRFTYTLQDNTNAQSKTANVGFSWIAASN
ncbi:hypothetical protein KIH74_07685 [Kineosporia sp. J2-2]|uniref:Camelysin metallo-endopeptidase n=1 Tax=Kineosporia corallincola TaxID=2835133 RepID=A0ABS5TCJ1_9ACTN|nr:M73 family metallopeptidase [Kineosporia corallincola]MBT0768802.1 hypothetical protein [Kineosporia corallincola]